MGKPDHRARLVTFNWKNPDYYPVFRRRLAILQFIEANPSYVTQLKLHYRDHIPEFIEDWGVTYDPRNPERGLPATMPFLLFDKQRAWVEFVIKQWRAQKPGLVEKSRDMGVTWLAVATSVGLCLHYDGLTIGFGSRKSEYVDKIGSLKPILPKARMFLEHIPEPLRGNHVPWRDAPYMRISIPDTGSMITGEGGDDIGRGDRASIFFVDEAAHLEHAERVEASLSQTTNCRIDMSSVRGMANPFAQKRWGGKIDVFVFDWRDDPRKDAEWYDKQVEQLDPVVVAQEIDRDYGASVKGVVIKGEWVRAAIGALEELGLKPTGKRGLSYDPADEGEDKNGLGYFHGVEVTETEEWSGKNSDIFASTEYVFEICEEQEYEEFIYDGDGLGADVRGNARILNERRDRLKQRRIRAIGYQGSEKVVDPEGIVEGTTGTEGDRGRLNKDYYLNRKAQAVWALRKRFLKTYRWVVKKVPCHPDEIISLSRANPNLMKLVAELSQYTYRQTEIGKMQINKKPDGTKSPNMADTVVQYFAPKEPTLDITPAVLNEVLSAMGMMGRRAGGRR